jgi:hypothetical protein
MTVVLMAQTVSSLPAPPAAEEALFVLVHDPALFLLDDQSG